MIYVAARLSDGLYLHVGVIGTDRAAVEAWASSDNGKMDEWEDRWKVVAVEDGGEFDESQL